MPNLIVTFEQSQRGSSCFAQERHLARGPGSPTHMAWGDLVTAINYFEQAREPVVPLVGGEPGLHPEIVAICRYVLARRLRVEIQTAGLLDAALVDALGAALAPEKSHCLVLVRPEGERLQGETEGQARFFEVLGGVSSLSCCVDRPDADLGFLLELISIHRLRRRIRLSLRHPADGGSGGSLSPDRFEMLAELVARLAARCEREDVILELDCGFTLCDFSDAHLGALARAGTELSFRCGPIIEIAPDLTTWACFPLHELAPQPLEQHQSFAALRAFFAEAVRSEMSARGFCGVHSQCDGCRHLARGRCAGGCRAHGLPEAKP